MAQEIINVGTTPNDGLGDPLRTAFTKTNNNFTQLFATAGITGIANGTSNVNIPQANGNVTISSAGTANVLIVTGTGVNVAGSLNSSGLATFGNLSVTGTTVSTGTIQSLSDVTAVDLAASANITAAGFLFGDGGFISNITAVSNLAVTLIANGSTSVATTGSGANVAVSVGGVSNVVVFATTGEYVTGVISASGNITGGNLRTNGLISATGGITTDTTISAQGNVTVGNVLTGGLISATGNVTSGNILTGGLISATGNVSGNYILGNGALLTGVITSVANINSGTSNITVVSSGGNITVGVGGTANVVAWATTGEYVTGVVSVSGNITTGSNLVTSGTTINSGVTTSGLVSATGNVTGGNLLTSGLVSATGNVDAGNLRTSGLITATGNVDAGNLRTSGLITATGNVDAGNLVTGGIVSATGNVLGNVFTVNLGNTATAIINGGGNAVGNIGSTSKYFDRVFAQATTALYADLAEIYSADAEYPPGTVVSFGGDQEITKSILAGDPRVAGVISDSPSYLMNAALQAEHRAAVALTGRVPTRVIGPVAKGDMMVSAGNGYAQASAAPAMGTVIGKALENFSNDSGTIEIVVGRM